MMECPQCGGPCCQMSAETESYSVVIEWYHCDWCHWESRQREVQVT